MVAGIQATYDAFKYVEKLRAALTAPQIANTAKSMDSELATLANGPTGLGTAHRDLERRLNDMLVGDVQPTASVISGVDNPCREIDAMLNNLRRLQTKIPELNAMLARESSLPSWTPPASPACGK